MNEGDVCEIGFFENICCEECEEVTGYLFTCPLCEEGVLTDDDALYFRDEATCEECHSIFEILGEEGDKYHSLAECKVKLVFKGKKKEKV